MSNPPAFLCHYYNHYFAHTGEPRPALMCRLSVFSLGGRTGRDLSRSQAVRPVHSSQHAPAQPRPHALPNVCSRLAAAPHAAGGRMIGKSVSNAVLDGWTGEFYTWEGDVKVGPPARMAGCTWLCANVGCKTAMPWSSNPLGCCGPPKPAHEGASADAGKRPHADTVPNSGAMPSHFSTGPSCCYPSPCPCMLVPPNQASHPAPPLTSQLSPSTLHPAGAAQPGA